MPIVTRSQSSRRCRRPSDSPPPPTSPPPPPPGLQPTLPRRRRRSSIANNSNDDNNNNDDDDNDNDNETETDSNDEEETDTIKDDQKGQAIQLNLHLALPPPYNRQLLSLCFHAFWRTRRRLRIHFTNRGEVLLDACSSSSSSTSSSSSSDGDSDPEHQHDKLTVIDYDPIAVPSHPSSPSPRWLVPLIIACFVAASALILAAVLGHHHLQLQLQPPLRLSFEPPHARPRPITLRNLTTLTHPYARLVRLLDTDTPPASLPAIQREFAELCTLARALAIPPDACHDIVDLLDDAGVHLARVLVGTRAQAGPGNSVSALRDTVILMAWGIHKQQQEQAEAEAEAEAEED
ncbi:hypothetical protein CTA2_7118, partial [Colletotrichum tanaceti]